MPYSKTWQTLLLWLKAYTQVLAGELGYSKKLFLEMGKHKWGGVVSLVLHLYIQLRDGGLIFTLLREFVDDAENQ